MEVPLQRSEVESRIDSLYTFLSEHRALCDAHAVDFFTHDHWGRVVDPQWRDELMHDLIGRPEEFIFPTSPGTPGSAREFLWTAKSLRLPMSCDNDAFVSKQTEDPRLLKFGMNTKKSHEVEGMSRLVADMASRLKVNQVLDVGSGKGYLSEYLALRHGLTVVGVDSQHSVTQGACKRNIKVHKTWKNTSVVKRDCSRPSASEAGVETEVEPLADPLALQRLFENVHTPSQDEDEEEEEEEEEGMSLVDASHRGRGSMKTTLPPNKSGGTSLHAPERDLRTFKDGSNDVIIDGSYTPVTMTVAVGSAWALLHEAERATGGRFSPACPCALVGLHTCGDLCSTALRLFAALPSAACLCVVGCCYHHISERDQLTRGACSPGFPMSSFLKDRGAFLGRNARMLACQNLYRFKESTEGLAMESVFFRCIFQLTLQKVFHSNFKETDYHINKLKYPTGDFVAYTRAACLKLKLSPSKGIESNAGKLLQNYLPMKQCLMVFIQLRGVLAQCVESLLILDKVLYLQEQLTVQRTQLIQLFQPQVSPRCFAIVAEKR